MHPTAILDDLLSGGFVADQVAQGNADAVWERLRLRPAFPRIGSIGRFRSARGTAEDAGLRRGELGLCVEYIDDLRRPPVAEVLDGMSGLPRPVIDTCRAVAAHLRERHAVFYKRTADETEAMLVDEVDAAKAEDLGRVDTFRFEEDTVLEAALDVLDRARLGHRRRVGLVAHRFQV